MVPLDSHPAEQAAIRRSSDGHVGVGCGREVGQTLCDLLWRRRIAKFAGKTGDLAGVFQTSRLDREKAGMWRALSER